MKHNKFIAVIFALLVCVLTPTLLSAQSSGDNLYNQGLKLQKTMTVKSQNAAIDKFTKAKKLYDSQAKKNQCDQAIEVSRGIIKQLQAGSGSGRGNGSQQQTTVVKEPSISVSNSEFGIDCKSKSIIVAVATSNVNEWKAMPVSNDDGSSFISVTKSGDGSSISIFCNANPTTVERKQKVEISGDGAKAFVTVVQQGRPINIVVEKPLIEFSKKGGKKDNVVMSNNNDTYSDNNDCNWHVVSKPDWIEIVINNKPQKSGGFLGKVVDKVKEVATGDSDMEVNSDMTSTPITITADKIAKGTSEFDNGRKAEIILGAGNKTISILVTQK